MTSFVLVVSIVSLPNSVFVEVAISEGHRYDPIDHESLARAAPISVPSCPHLISRLRRLLPSTLSSLSRWKTCLVTVGVISPVVRLECDAF